MPTFHMQYSHYRRFAPWGIKAICHIRKKISKVIHELPYFQRHFQPSQDVCCKVACRGSQGPSLTPSQPCTLKKIRTRLDKLLCTFDLQNKTKRSREFREGRGGNALATPLIIAQNVCLFADLDSTFYDNLDCP